MNLKNLREQLKKSFDGPIIIQTETISQLIDLVEEAKEIMKIYAGSNLYRGNGPHTQFTADFAGEWLKKLESGEWLKKLESSEKEGK